MPEDYSSLAQEEKFSVQKHLAKMVRQIVSLLGVNRGVTVDMICLANSRKYGGRCIAGLRTDGSGWVRPVSSSPSGTLQPIHYQMKGREAQLMDRLILNLTLPCPKPYQPENWTLLRKWYNPWHKPCRSAAPLPALQVRSLLEAHRVSGPELLGCRRDRVEAGVFAQTPASASLALVRAENLRWQIKTSSSGKRQTRAVFGLAGTVYNLSVTDPVWEQKLGDLAFGIHPHKREAGEDADVFLTISLGEPFEGCCYKLVAAIITLPVPDREDRSLETR